ncbi:MAG: hypothetical protein Q4F00_12755 [bacterium]|nr:hypothetical protein [bacterium]
MGFWEMAGKAAKAVAKEAQKNSERMAEEARKNSERIARRKQELDMWDDDLLKSIARDEDADSIDKYAAIALLKERGYGR